MGKRERTQTGSPLGTSAARRSRLHPWGLAALGAGLVIRLSLPSCGVSPVLAQEPSTGKPLAFVALPPWAESARPWDRTSAGTSGPSAADRVDLASGVYLHQPSPDIIAKNPVGPDATFSRSYSSAVAQRGYASPGLSIGWTHPYDVALRPKANLPPDQPWQPLTACLSRRPGRCGGNPRPGLRRHRLRPHGRVPAHSRNSLCRRRGARPAPRKPAGPVVVGAPCLLGRGGGASSGRSGRRRRPRLPAWRATG